MSHDTVILYNGEEVCRYYPTALSCFAAEYAREKGWNVINHSCGIWRGEFCQLVEVDTLYPENQSEGFKTASVWPFKMTF